MTDEKILPCPFCGMVPSKVEYDADNKHFVICCVCPAMPIVRTLRRPLAVEYWNRRATPRAEGTDGTCSRCHNAIVDFRPAEGGMTAGYYQASAWQKYANAGEVIICDACMWQDARYIADYGKMPPVTTPAGTDAPRVTEEDVRFIRGDADGFADHGYEQAHNYHRIAALCVWRLGKEDGK